MQIVSGMSWEQPDGTWRKLSVSLDSWDLQRMVSEGKVAGASIESVEEVTGRAKIVKDGKPLTTEEAYKTLQKQADRLLIYQMAKDGAMKPEEAARQIQAL